MFYLYSLVFWDTRTAQTRRQRQNTQMCPRITFSSLFVMSPHLGAFSKTPKISGGKMVSKLIEITRRIKLHKFRLWAFPSQKGIQLPLLRPISQLSWKTHCLHYPANRRSSRQKRSYLCCWKLEIPRCPKRSSWNNADFWPRIARKQFDIEEKCQRNTSIGSSSRVFDCSPMMGASKAVKLTSDILVNGDR